MYPDWAYVTDRSTTNPSLEATGNVKNLTNYEEKLTAVAHSKRLATDSHVAEKKILAPIPDANLFRNSQGGATNLSEDRDLTHQSTERLSE